MDIPLPPRWVLAPPEPARAEKLSQFLGVPPLVAQLLINRGLTGEEEAKQFLNPSQDQLLSPGVMKGMDKAVERIRQALDRGEKIVIHGDYDADGITATAILVETLRELGGKVGFFLPSRFQEGYGLHREALTRIRDEGASLVITVDCGITAIEESLYAQKIGLDLIITDHHLPLDRLPETAAVINPHRVDCPYSFKWLSGAGVAFKLATALLEGEKKEFLYSLLDLAALGTVADMVPLLGENRVLVALGLKAINCGQRRGLKALAEVGGINRGNIDSTTLSFALAPLLNAAGRMGEADPAVHLLLEHSPERAEELARYLGRQNRLRRDTESKIFTEAEAIILKDPPAAGEKVITLAGEGWHPGVIGIVASRLVERFHRPAVVVAVEKGIGCGSARSIPGFDIVAALAASAGLLERYGGHHQAAGLIIDPGRVAELREELNKRAVRHLPSEDPIPRIYIEGELSAEQINLAMAGHLSALEPFGTANPPPLFCTRFWELHSWRLVGSGKRHLKFNFKKSKQSIRPILFSGASIVSRLYPRRKLDLAFNLSSGTFRDQPVLNMELKDFCYSDSSLCGRVEVIDRRGGGDRVSYIGELVRRSGDAVVFVNTRQRIKMLKQRLPEEVVYISSGKTCRGRFSQNTSSELVLYDLPLHSRLLIPYLREHRLLSKIRIHLLYNCRSRKVNEQLTALALPGKQALQEIYRVMMETAAGDDDPLSFPGPWKERLSFSPGKQYWKYCRDILVEIGVLSTGANHRLKLMPGGENWVEKLKHSSAFQSTHKLAEECRQFQEQLLEENKQQLAGYFDRLLKRCSETGPSDYEGETVDRQPGVQPGP